MDKFTLQKDNNESNFLTRFLTATKPRYNSETRTISFTFSSKRPTERWAWGDDLPEGSSNIFDEILSHDSKAWNIERVSNGVCPYLKNHNRNDKLGQVLKVSFDGEKGYCDVKLRRSLQADQLIADIEDNIAGGISFGYIPKEYKVIKPAEYEEDKWGYKVLKTKAILEGTNIELLEISSEEIPADPTVGFGKSDRSVIYLKSINLEGNPNFSLEKGKDNKSMDLEKELVAVKQERDVLTIEHTRATTQASELTKQLSEKVEALEKATQQLNSYQKREQIFTKYYSLRSKAEQLNSEGKLSAIEFDELFSDKPSEDIEGYIKAEEDKLGYIGFHLSLLEKRSPLLNTSLAVKGEPLPQTKENLPEAKASSVDETRVERLLNIASSSPMAL